MVFAGAKFCSHCGAAIAREEIPAAKVERCPRCRIPMESVLIGNTNLRECSHCQGIWADTDSLQRICADREQQAAFLGAASPLPDNLPPETNFRYVPCPVCTKLMNRVAFANCSRVVVDVCKAHGTWFDKDELRRIVEFIRSGGMDVARQRETAELKRQREMLRSAQITSYDRPALSVPPQYADDFASFLGSAAWNILMSFIKR
jgi:Zn-finger nucleic acid-binding protein